ncbi:MAG: OmpP1/FadL family transporter, partial [Thermodesulfobacteriota bacterium]
MRAKHHEKETARDLMSTLRFIVMIVVLLCLPVRSMAGGPVHGARAAGMGTAFVALADDPSAILFNAAGIASIRGTEIYGGNTVLTINSDYLDKAGRTEETDFNIFTTPHLYITTDLGRDNITIGLGVYAPFGIGGRSWPLNGLTKFTSTRAEIATLSVNPTVAIKVTPQIMVGAGLDYMGAYSLAEKMLDQGIFGAGDGKLRLKGYGYGLGFNAGAIVRLKKLNVGLAYRSEIEVDIEGQLEMEAIAP